MIRYRFGAFVLSRQRRLLLRDGQEVSLIPKYFDLLLLLVERRQEAVHRREIFERVWGDVIVSDSALSQAVRTIRRTLDDDSSEPKFIRTVSRHGYQFVFPDVVEEPEVLTGHAPVPESVQARPVVSSDDVPVPDEIPLWIGAARGAAIAGVAAGGVGGVLLAVAPGGTAPLAIAPVLAAIGGGCGLAGGAGVGGGLTVAEKSAGGPHVFALAGGAAIGGAVVGAIAEWMARWALIALFGLPLNIGGGFEGLVIGAGAGIGYALALRSRSTLAATVALAACCGLAGLLLSLGGHVLVGGTIHAMADAADGSHATLAPLGRLLGEPGFGPVSQSILAFGECAAFGAGLALGLKSRFLR